MKLKMKLRKRLRFTATAFLMMFGANAQSLAQKSAEAVMTVSVKIISAPKFVDNIITDITDQLQDQKSTLTLGEYKMKFPKGTGYTFSFDPVIKMQNDTSSWEINTRVQQKRDDQGMLTLNFTGEKTNTSVQPGQYVGQLTTHIEYN